MYNSIYNLNVTLVIWQSHFTCWKNETEFCLLDLTCPLLTMISKTIE